MLFPVRPLNWDDMGVRVFSALGPLPASSMHVHSSVLGEIENEGTTGGSAENKDEQKA